MQLANIKSLIYHGIYFNLIKLLTRVRKNTFLFNSFFGKSFSGNPRAIFDELLKWYPDGEYIIVLDNLEEEKELVRNYPDTNFIFISRHKPGYLKSLARASYWIMDINFPYRLKPQKKTKFIQTWHGTPLKHIGNDLPDNNSFKKQTEKEPLNWDFFISNSTNDEWIYRSAFNLTQTQVLNYGLPRNDVLIKEKNNSKLINDIKKQLNLNNNKNILYAPTFRDNESIFKLKIDLERFEAQFSDEFNLLIRLHPNVASLFKLEKNYKNIYNVSQFSDISSLYLVSDILITDYSSVFFDYSLLKRPIIFYTYDLDKYQDILRGFYFDFEKFVPGPIVRNEDELFNILKRPLKTTDVEIFSSKHNGNTDELAASRIVQKVWSITDEKNNI